MNLEQYRSAFTVFVADSNLERGPRISTALSDVGYSCELKLFAENLEKDILKNPPHIIIFNYEDEAFFEDVKSYKEVIEHIQSILPEVHILFLTENNNFSQACALYELGVYDILIAPFEHPMQLLKAVDRAAENDYHIYLNEQLKAFDDGDSLDEDFARFHVWLKGLDKTETKEQGLHHFMKEAARLLHTEEAIYFKFIESKKLLVLEDSIGFQSDELKDIGLDLGEEEPGFSPLQLFEPHRILALSEFVQQGLSRPQGLFFPFIQENKVVGLFVLLAKKGQVFADDAQESGYLHTCLDMIYRRFEFTEMKLRLAKYSIYDSESEAFHQNYIYKKIRDEISRARRISNPVSLLYISIDMYDEMALSLPRKQFTQFLKAFTEVLVTNSRLNDIAGRMDRGHFVLCLPHTDIKGATIKAERLRRLFESSDVTSLLDQDSKITVSIGISEYPLLCKDVDSFIQTAESAQLEVFKEGGNKICIAAVPARFEPDFVAKGKNSAQADSR
jgi:diguanylate cyclase (GGDEF)-like protein